MELAVVILNYQGAQHLQTFLPSVIAHTAHPIYVADNGSTDDSLAILEEKFPEVRIIELRKNYGFAGGYNEALRQIDAEYFLLLNSDVAVTKGWIEPLLHHLKNDLEVVACQPKIRDYKNPQHFEYAGASGGFIDRFGYPFCRGRLFEHCERDIGQHNDPREVFWTTGACMLIRASGFWEVNGFDADLFAHMEEIDLCWRLRNRGHKMSCVPGSVVYHLGGGTLNAQSPRKTFLNFRNNLIVIYKNDRKPKFKRRFLGRLTLDGIAAIHILFTRGWSHFAAVFKAHMSFYGSFSANRKKRRAEGVFIERPNQTGTYAGSVVWDYFLKGRTVFSALPTAAFQRQDRRK